MTGIPPTDAELATDAMNVKLAQRVTELWNENQALRQRASADAELVALVLAEARAAADPEYSDRPWLSHAWQVANRELQAAVQARLDAEAGS